MEEEQPLDLLVVGDANPDVIVDAPGLEPRFGQVEQLVDSAALVIGGSAAITAIGAARLGLRVGICAVVGDDDSGAYVTAGLHAASVDANHLAFARNNPTGLSVILNRGSDRAVLTAPGTISALSAEQLADLPDHPARHVHVSSYYLMSGEFQRALPDALARFRTAGATTSVDTNWDPTEQWQVRDLLESVDVFIPNQAELLAISGSRLLDAALVDVAKSGCDVVVKRGEQGGVAHSDGCIYRVTKTPPVQFEDAVGAGDSFNAGYLAGRLLGRDAGVCLAMGVVAGSLSTASVGGTAAQPTLDEVDGWLSRISVTAEDE